jgi:hypothetical protein
MGKLTRREISAGRMLDNARLMPLAQGARVSIGIGTAGTSIASIFGVVLIVLMVCNEFGWKTSRQNIIDGLSKPQWFAGKALLIPTVAVHCISQFSPSAVLWRLLEPPLPSA